MIRLCRVSEIPPGGMLCVEPEGLAPIAVYNVGGTFFATDDRCTHAEASLSDGILEGHVVECPFHGGTFDVRTGEALEPPCTIPVRVYRATVVGDEVWLEENPA